MIKRTRMHCATILINHIQIHQILRRFIVRQNICTSTVFALLFARRLIKIEGYISLVASFEGSSKHLNKSPYFYSTNRNDHGVEEKKERERKREKEKIYHRRSRSIE